MILSCTLAMRYEHTLKIFVIFMKDKIVWDFKFSRRRVW
jgi:hypothetical protein